MRLNFIYNENCLNTMKKILDGGVDLVITSPPYNMNLRIRNGKYCSRQIVKEFSTKYEDFPDNLSPDKFYGLHAQILNELIRVSKTIFYNISIVTGSKRSFFKLIGDFSDNLKDIIVWDKGSGQPAMQQQILNRRYELILIFESQETAISRQFQNGVFKRGSLDDIWLIKRGSKPVDCHRAIFPVELVEKILLNFSREGDLIYDPFMGSGTTAVVCKRNHRKFIGSEISKRYCEEADKRLRSLR